jgi:tripartite-type tricarboxylate transporter receptor subunit TctC
MPYDPVRSFTPIVRFAAAPYLLVVKPGGSASLEAFVEQAQAAHSQGRDWRYASTGTGGPHHLVAEFYFQRAGLTLTHIPAAGGAAALAKLSDGGVEAMLPAAILALPKIRSGELKALAVTGNQRLKALPDVPTFAELGIPVDVESWYGLMAPAGLPPAQARLLAKTVREIFSDPAVEAQLSALATQATVEEGEAFANLVALEVARWKALVTGLGIQSDAKGD